MTNGQQSKAPTHQRRAACAHNLEDRSNFARRGHSGIGDWLLALAVPLSEFSVRARALAVPLSEFSICAGALAVPLSEFSIRVRALAVPLSELPPQLSDPALELRIRPGSSLPFPATRRTAPFGASSPPTAVNGAFSRRLAVVMQLAPGLAASGPLPGSSVIPCRVFTNHSVLITLRHSSRTPLECGRR